MPVSFLEGNDFPDPRLANEYGLVAVGGDLSSARLIRAYRLGLFPWYNAGEPILWWCLDPRLILKPEALKVSKSMRSYFNREKFTVTYNTAFERVLLGCRQKERKGQSGTWITDDIIEAYCRLRRLGYAHSVEVWKADKLVGGLYGVALGKCFFGESMFALESNASKFGFITLVRKLQDQGCWLVDCQQETDHLASMGAEPIPREEFLKIMKRNEENSDFYLKF